MLSYNDFLWGDSLLIEIRTRYEEIWLSIFNETLAKDVIIHCSNCIEISQIAYGEDWMIDSMSISTISATDNLCRQKPSEEYTLLEMKMISGQQYTIKCKNITFDVIEC